MYLIAVGLDTGSAPLALRERLVVSQAALPDALAILRALMAGPDAPLAEGIILSTCHRLEVYAVALSVEAGQGALVRFLSALRGVPAEAFAPHLVVRHGETAAAHCFRLAAGLASPVVGDSQILGQMRAAYEAAGAAGAAGPVLAALFQHAARAAKRVHTETALNRRVSVGYTGAAVALRACGVATPEALIIGAGQMAQRAAWYLRKHGAGRICVANRSVARARDLARRVGGEPVAWGDLPAALAGVDIAIAATSAPETVIAAATVAAAMRQRPGRPLHLVDLAVPRDIAPESAALPNVSLKTVDDLAGIVDDVQERQRAAIPHAEAIVAAARAGFETWYAARAVAPLIGALRSEAERIRRAEIRRIYGDALPTGTEAARLDALTKGIIAKLLHHPTVRLKEAAAAPGCTEYAAVAGDLFGISEAERGGLLPAECQGCGRPKARRSRLGECVQ